MTKTVVALVLAVLTADAAAVSAHTLSFRFGKKGSGNGEFNLPLSAVVDPEGSIWVADTFNHRIQKFSSTGAHLRNFGSQGSGDGQFNLPSGLAISDSGRLYIGDSDNFRIQAFTLILGFVSRFGSRGLGDGQFFGGSIKVATDSANNLYTLDSHALRVQKFAPDGRFLLKWGAHGSGSGGLFLDVADIAVDGSNNIWVADRLGDNLQKFNSNGVHLLTVATFRLRLQRPISLAVDSFDNLYVGIECGTVGKFDSNGQLLTRIGVAACPHGLAFDAQDNLYVVESSQTDYFVEVFRADTDRDGLRGSQDLDSDNDGIPDVVEKTPLFLAAVGVAGAYGDEASDDPDGDGIRNEYDLDSDGDGIPDGVEAGGQDENGDGLVDGFADDDQNGLADHVDAEPLPLPDTDGDGIADFLDGDSDDDGATDVREAGGDDADGDGMLDDFLDAAADGLADSVESGTGMPLPLLDANRNGIPDYRDSQQTTEVEHDDDGCAVVRPQVTSSSLLYLLLPIVVWIARASTRKRMGDLQR